MGAHLEVLKWARAHACPWNHQTRECAAIFEDSPHHVELLQWAVAHGAP
jgi:hypothetical protein